MKDFRYVKRKKRSTADGNASYLAVQQVSRALSVSHLQVKTRGTKVSSLSKNLHILIQLRHSLFFRKEHLEVPLNKGEKRESLVILEKVGLYSGLL